jgi:2'-5' RNA ligase
MRLFLAAEPDAAVRELLAERIAALKREAGESARAFRWTTMANLHVTLHFLGEVDATRLPALETALTPPLRTASFLASIGEVGTFPERGAPRVIWIGVGDGAPEMREVHAELGERLRALGFEVDPRPFTPHFTVGRARERGTRGARLAFRQGASAGSTASWRVEQVTLFQSDMSSAPPTYVSLATTPLSTPP